MTLAYFTASSRKPNLRCLQRVSLVILVVTGSLSTIWAQDFLSEFKEVNTRYYESPEHGYSLEYGYLLEPGDDPIVDSDFYASEAYGIPSVSVQVRDKPEGLSMEEALSEYLEDIPTWEGLRYLDGVDSHVTTTSEFEAWRQEDEENRKVSPSNKHSIEKDTEKFGEEVEELVVVSTHYEGCSSGCFVTWNKLAGRNALEYYITLETTSVGRHLVFFHITTIYSGDQWYLLTRRNNANHYRMSASDLGTYHALESFSLLEDAQ